MRSVAPVYLDNNATTAIAPECLQAMVSCLRQGALNPSSKHSLGEHAKLLVAEARGLVAELLGATPPEIVFTSGGTESNHQAILGALALQPERCHIVSSAVEHSSTLMLLRQLQARGVHVSYLPVDAEGRLELQALEDTVTSRTALVSLMWANNETGVLFPIAAAARCAHAHGALFHTDAVQVIGKLPVDVKQSEVDLLSLSGHKLHAPAGVGALYVRKGLQLPPLLLGHQERGRRGSTENVSGIVALGAACGLWLREGAADTARMQALRDRLEAGLLARMPSVRINGGRVPRVPNTSNVCFGEIEAEVLLDQLDRRRFYAASGAACTAAQSKPSHVLTAMGLSAAAALSSVRFSLGRYNRQHEVDALLQTLPGLLQELAERAA